MIITRLILVLVIITLLVLLAIVLIALERRRWRRAREIRTEPADPSVWQHYDDRFSDEMVRRRTEELGGSNE